MQLDKRKEEIKLSLFVSNIPLYQETPRESMLRLAQIIKELYKVADTKLASKNQYPLYNK